MIMVFKQDPASLVPLVFDLQDRVRREHNKIAGASRFEFRGVIHSGPVFKYSDINERLSYAGTGISLPQRVLAAGKAWHLLATQEAQDLISKSDEALARVFHKSQRKTKTKSVAELVIYNVHDDMGHGNPAEFGV